MKYLMLLLTFLAFGLTSCMDDDDMDCNGFGEGDVLTLPDGRNVRIIDIDDQLCPCDAICVWPGQFVVTFEEVGNETQRDTFNLPAYSFAVAEMAFLYDFPLAEWDPNLVNNCSGEVPEDELCFTIGF